MSKVKVVEYSGYDKVIVLDKHSLSDIKNKSLYFKLIRGLELCGIIDTKYNKIKFIKKNVCIVYNINNLGFEYDEIKRFGEVYGDKMTKNNIKFVLLEKDNDIIYKINDTILLHSKLIKKLFALNQFTDILDSVEFESNIFGNINEIIRELIINIVKNKKLTNSCFNDIKKKIDTFIKKDSLHINKVNSIEYLDKTCIIYLYEKHIEKFIKVGHMDNGILEIQKGVIMKK